KMLVGVAHVGIGSDLRGMSGYTKEFGQEADFAAIGLALLERGYSEDEVGAVMGGNFFRIWEVVSGDK
ncbi:dipeptidase, partial [bacterium]|nr:dipeptidase [bacterium]